MTRAASHTLLCANALLIAGAWPSSRTALRAMAAIRAANWLKRTPAAPVA